MSLDISLICKCCESELLDLNYTYNLVPVWKKARPDASKMVDIDNMSGERSLVILNEVINNIKSDIANYEKLNPDNGWGSVNSFLEFLEKLKFFAEKHPDATWKTYR